jgi:hypothetical protein
MRKSFVRELACEHRNRVRVGRLVASAGPGYAIPAQSLVCLSLPRPIERDNTSQERAARAIASRTEDMPGSLYPALHACAWTSDT